MPVLQTKKMSQNGHEERSCPKRPGAAHAARRPGAARPVRAGQRRPHCWAEQPPLPLIIHLAAPPGGAVPNLEIRPVRPAHQRHGNRQYLRVSREAVVLSGGMGAEYPLLPRVTSDRPGCAVEARLVGTVCAKRVPVLYAAACGTFASCSRSSRLADGGGPRCRLHGSHTDLPRASGEAESSPRRLRGVLLSEGHRPLHDRCVRPLGRITHRESTGEVPVRARRILQESVPEPAHEVREAAPPTALTKDRQLASHRAAVLRAAGGEDAHRDPHKGHASLGEFVLVAVHGDHVTHNVEAAGGGMIHALRLPAVSAEPAVRPVPKVPA